jgi:hypothetical protein
MAYSPWLGPTAFFRAATGMVLWKRVRMADGGWRMPNPAGGMGDAG